MTLSPLDWILFSLLSIVGFSVVWFYSGYKKKQDPKYAYLPAAFGIKLLGGAIFAIIFFYLYKVGDTFLYFGGSRTLSQFFWENPDLYFKALFSNSEQTLSMIPGIHYEIPYARTDEEWFMVRILSVFQIISFNNYLIMVFWTSMFSFVGSWAIFEVFNSWFNNSTKLAFACAFLVPTVIFWSSGIIKDSLVFGLIGLAFYCFYRLFINSNKNLILYALVLLLSLTVIYKLKSYIVISLIPPLFFAAYLRVIGTIKSPLIKQLSGPLLIAVFGVSLFVLVNQLAESTEKYKIENLEKQTRGFHTWHVTTGGSTYNLGEIEYTASGVVRKIPAALNVTFFRPYIWEIRNATTALAAVESLIFLLLFVYFIFYKGIRSVRFVFSDPILGFGIIFCFILGFAAGFTSYNFGALVRYKMPIMPFFTFMLIYTANLKWRRKANFA